MIGLALSAVIVTVIADTLKVYLARVPGAVTSIPGGLRKKSFWGRLLGRLRLPFSKLAYLPSGWRRTLLIRSLIGGAIMFVIGLVIVTGVELSVGKNLSCWVWDNCYTESSAGGENATDAGSMPSIFIARNSLSASAPQVTSSTPQPPPAPPVAPTPPASSPSSSGNGSQPAVSEQPSISQQQPSSVNQSEQQRSEYRQQGEYQQSSSSSSSESQPQSLPSSSESQQPSDSQQQSPTPPASPAPSRGTNGAG